MDRCGSDNSRYSHDLIYIPSPQKLQSNFYHNSAYGSYHSILGNKQAACIKINASGLNIQSLFSNILDWHLTNSCHCFIIYFLAFFRLDHFLKYLFIVESFNPSKSQASLFEILPLFFINSSISFSRLSAFIEKHLTILR